MSHGRDPNDESAEIEIIPASADAPAAPTAAPPAAAGPATAPGGKRPARRRTPNPEADEVIHTGEISPRSMIVRASSQPVVQRIEPKIEIQEDPTEITSRPLMPPAPAVTKPRWIWLAAAALPAIAAVALLVADRRGGEAAQVAANNQADMSGLQAAAQFIGTTLDGQAHAIQARAEAMAATPMLRAAIETDAQTVENMAKDHDVTFPIKPGETLEIIQLSGTTHTPMLRLPSAAKALPAIEIGQTRIEAVGNGVIVVVSAAVPSQKNPTAGELVISAPVDLDPMKKRVAEHAQQATLVGLATPIAFGAGPGNGGSKVTLPIPTDSKLSLQLEATLPEASAPAAGTPGRSGTLGVVRYACMGLAGLLVIGFFAASARRSPQRA